MENRKLRTCGKTFAFLPLFFFVCELVYERCVDVIHVCQDDKFMLVKPCVCNYCLLFQTV